MADSSTTLSIVLKLVDEATGAMGGVTKALEANKASFIEMGAVAGVAFGAVTLEMKESTEAAGRFQNTEAQLNAVLLSTKAVSGETADRINELADSLEKTTGYSKDTIVKIDTLLIGFKDIGQDVIPGATQAILDFAARTGNDAVEATNMLGKALANPKIAVGALTREHVMLTQAQQDAIAQFVKVGDTAGAQRVIIEALNQTFGGAAEQTGTLAFQQRMLKSQMEELQVAVGTTLLPLLTKLLAAMMPIIIAVTDWMTAHPKLTAAILLTVAAVSGLMLGVSALALAVLALDVVSLPWIAIMAGIMIAVGLLALAAYNLYQRWDELKRLGADIGQILVQVWNAFRTTMKGIWDQIVGDVKSAVNSVIDIIDGMISAINSIHIHIPSVNVGGVHIGGQDIGFNIPTIPHLADGGIVNGPTLALIGEAGPEAVVPLSGSRGMGGVTVNVNGGYYLDERASRDFANMIARTVNDQLKLRTF